MSINPICLPLIELTNVLNALKGQIFSDIARDVSKYPTTSEHIIQWYKRNRGIIPAMAVLPYDVYRSVRGVH